MKVIIAGSRHFDDYDKLKDQCSQILSGRTVDAILCGECSGADVLGKRWAEENGINVESFPADWKRYGKAAGVKRNAEMAKHADMLIAFWNGQSRGTLSMIRLMQGKEVEIVYIDK